MKPTPLIAISPSTARRGAEFADASISLSNRYLQAIIDAGGMPLAMPCVPDAHLVGEMVRRADGVLLTGGDDVQPELYAPNLPARLRKTVSPASPERDRMELLVID